MFISCFWKTFGRDFLKKNSHLLKLFGGRVAELSTIKNPKIQYPGSLQYLYLNQESSRELQKKFPRID
jgi:hypothetical protein